MRLISVLNCLLIKTIQSVGKIIRNSAEEIFLEVLHLFTEALNNYIKRETNILDESFFSLPVLYESAQ